MAQKSLDIDYITLRKIRAVNHTNNTNPTKNYILATNGRGDCDWTNTIENIATYGAYIGSSFMVVGGSGTNPLAYDRDGIHWYGSSNGANLFYNGQALCGAWNGVLWVVGGQSFDPSGGPTLVYSSDGITWSDNSGADLVFDIGGQCNAVAWDGEKWLAGGSKSNLIAGNAMRLLQSSDGITWSRVNTDSAGFANGEICTALAWNGSVWLMGTNYQGDIWSSLDGITWEYNTCAFNNICKSIAWNGRLWVATGDYNNSYLPSIMTSSDANANPSSWTPSISGATVFPAICNSVAWNGSLWVAAGNSDGSEGSSTLAYSRDGQTWTPSVNGLSLFPATCNSVIWNGSLWVAGGIPGSGGQPLAYSSDGMTWFPSISETSQLSVVNFVASSQVLPYIGINKTGPVLHQELGPGGRVVYDTSGQNLYISRILTVQEPGTEDGSGTVIVKGDVLPVGNQVHSLGSPTQQWKDFYVGGSSIHIGDKGIINANNNGAIGINYLDPSSNPLISLEVGKASYFHESVGINTAPFTSFTISGEPIPALLIEGITQLGVSQPQFMSVYNNNNQVNGYIYGDVSDGSISIGYNYQNAKPIFSAHGTTVPTLGTSQIKMLEDTVVAYIDASQNNVNSPGTVGWSIIGNGLGNPASVGIGTEDPSPLYALDVAGASHVSNYMVVDGSLNSFSISTGAISSTTIYASTSVTAGNVSVNTLGLTTSQGAMRLGTTNLSGSETSITFDYTGFYPNSDNLLSLGFPDNQWSNLYVNNFNTTTLNANQLNTSSISTGSINAYTFTNNTTTITYPSVRCQITTPTTGTPISAYLNTPEQPLFNGYTRSYSGSIISIAGGGGGGGGGDVGGGGGAGGQASYVFTVNFTYTAYTNNDLFSNIMHATIGNGGVGGASGTPGDPGDNGTNTCLSYYDSSITNVIIVYGGSGGGGGASELSGPGGPPGPVTSESFNTSYGNFSSSNPGEVDISNATVGEDGPEGTGGQAGKNSSFPLYGNGAPGAKHGDDAFPGESGYMELSYSYTDTRTPPTATFSTSFQSLIVQNTFGINQNVVSDGGSLIGYIPITINSKYSNTYIPIYGY